MGCNPKFDAVLRKMADIHDKKSEDYASAEDRYSNFKFAAECARLFTDPLDQVFASLIGVKLARLGELRSSGKTPNHESIQDTRVDLANYAALWASFYESPNTQLDLKKLIKPETIQVPIYRQPYQPFTALNQGPQWEGNGSSRSLLGKAPATSGYVQPTGEQCRDMIEDGRKGQ